MPPKILLDLSIYYSQHYSGSVAFLRRRPDAFLDWTAGRSGALGENSYSRAPKVPRAQPRTDALLRPGSPTRSGKLKGAEKEIENSANTCAGVPAALRNLRKVVIAFRADREYYFCYSMGNRRWRAGVGSSNGRWSGHVVGEESGNHRQKEGRSTTRFTRDSCRYSSMGDPYDGCNVSTFGNSNLQ